jgi:hypothetical protein
MTQTQHISDAAHDFDFFYGRWRIHNQRLRERLLDCTEWDTFEATCDCKPLLDGFGNIDEFRTDYWPNFVGMSLRLFSPQTQQWSIYWVDTRQVVLQPPVVGGFTNGVGIFDGPDQLRGQPVIVRFTWSHITPTAARWQQAFSPDNGQTWETNWIMTFTRIGN